LRLPQNRIQRGLKAKIQSQNSKIPLAAKTPPEIIISPDRS